MDEEKKSLIRTLWLVSSMGISFALAIVIGVYCGVKLDEWFGTHHLFFYIFLIFGIIAGFRNIYLIARREIKKDENGKDN